MNKLSIPSAAIAQHSPRIQAVTTLALLGGRYLFQESDMVRLVLGAVVYLVVPGRWLSGVLYSTSITANRLFLSVVLSLGISPLVLFLLSRSGVPLGLESTFITICALTLVSMIVLATRGYFSSFTSSSVRQGS